MNYINLRTQIEVILGVALMKQSFAELLNFLEQQNFIQSAELQKDGSSNSVNSLVVINWQIQLIVDKWTIISLQKAVLITPMRSNNIYSSQTCNASLALSLMASNCHLVIFKERQDYMESSLNRSYGL